MKSLPATISTPTGEMVLVPAGSFLFGEKKEPVSLPAFYIDKTEVTNAAYADFCRATNRPLPPAFPRKSAGLPVVNVSILDAQLFVKWAGKRLPTAREWEKAARGTDGRDFPWGNEADPSKANIDSQADSARNRLPRGRQSLRRAADDRQRLGTGGRIPHARARMPWNSASS